MITERKKERSLLLMLSLHRIKEHEAEAGESRTGNEAKKELLCGMLIRV